MSHEAQIRTATADGLKRVVLRPAERSVPRYRRAGFGPADQLLLRLGSGPGAPARIVSRA